MKLAGMPLEPPDLTHLRAAEGYLALGMFEDANAELELIDPFCRILPEVLRVRLGIYAGAKNWELMRGIAKKLAQHAPDEPQWWISLGYATRRAESLGAARAVLIEALEHHGEEPIIHYNLGCYACQLGDLHAAKEHLKQAFRLQPKCREMALDDPDLEPMWSAIESD